MTLNETQAAAVCQAYCAMMDIQDAFTAAAIKPVILMDDEGALFVSPDGVKIPNEPSHFLRSLKDRTPAEIDSFKADWVKALAGAKDFLRQKRIDELKAELAELEPFDL